MQRFIKVLLIALPLFLLYLAVYVNLQSYEQILQILKPAIFFVPAEEPAYAVRFFTLQRYQQLQDACILIACCSLVVSGLLWYYQTSITAYLRNVWRETGRIIGGLYKRVAQLSRTEKTLILLTLCIIVGLRLIAITRLEPYGDEEWSYVGFVHQPFLITITYYPDTNNHIFFNLLCKPFDWIFTSPLWVMKAPVFLIGLLVLTLLFACTLTLFGFETAFLTTCLSGFLFETSFFALVGRAHIFAALLAIVSAFAIVKWVMSQSCTLNRRQDAYLFWFVTTSIIGLYTVPTFIFHVFALSFFVVYVSVTSGQKQLWKPLLLAIVIIALGTFLCYLPVLLVSGWKALTANRVVKPEDVATVKYAFPVHLVEQVEYIFGMYGVLKRGYIYALAILGLLLLLSQIKLVSYPQRLWLLLTLFSEFAPFLVILLLRSFPPYRVFVYLMYILHLALVIAIVWALRPLLHKPVVNRLVCILLLAAMIFINLTSYQLL